MTEEKQTCKCPICGSKSTLDSCDEVDIGVGTISGNHLWSCPIHGLWAVNDKDVYRRSHSFTFLTECFQLLRPFPPIRKVAPGIYR